MARKQTWQEIEHDRAADRIRNMSHLSDADLVKRLLAAERTASSSSASSTGAHYEADAAQHSVTMYRNELQRRQSVGA